VISGTPTSPAAVATTGLKMDNRCITFQDSPWDITAFPETYDYGQLRSPLVGEEVILSLVKLRDEKKGQQRYPTIFSRQYIGNLGKRKNDRFDLMLTQS